MTIVTLFFECHLNGCSRKDSGTCLLGSTFVCIFNKKNEIFWINLAIETEMSLQYVYAQLDIKLEFYLVVVKINQDS